MAPVKQRNFRSQRRRPPPGPVFRRPRLHMVAAIKNHGDDLGIVETWPTAVDGYKLFRAANPAQDARRQLRLNGTLEIWQHSVKASDWLELKQIQRSFC